MEIVKGLKLDKYHDVEHLKGYTERYGDVIGITIENDGYMAQVGPRLAFLMGSETIEDVMFVLSNIKDKLDMLPIMKWNAEKGYYDTVQVVETDRKGQLNLVTIN